MFRVSSQKGVTILTPTTLGEIPLVLQDKNLNTDGSYNYDIQSTAFHPMWAPESFGDIPVVNGVAFANVPVNRGLFRFRVYSASQARVYQRALRQFTWSAKAEQTLAIYDWVLGGSGRSDVGAKHRPQFAMPTPDLM